MLELLKRGKALLSKGNMLTSSKVVLTAYGYYITLKVSFMIVKKIQESIASKVTIYRVSKRSLQNVFADNAGKWAVVSGAGSGIGLEMAKLLNLCNFNVVAVDKNPEKIGKLVEQLYSDLRKTKIVGLQIDFKKDAAKVIFEKLENCMSENNIDNINLLVNNVGTCKLAPFISSGYQEIIDELKVNLSSHMALTTFFRNRINRSRFENYSGIIFVGDNLGSVAVPGYRTYPYAKALLHSVSKYIGRTHQDYFDSMIVVPSQVLTQSNNPQKHTTPDYTKVDLASLGFGWATAADCAKQTFLNFGLTGITGGVPRHEELRLLLPYYEFFVRLRMLRRVQKLMEGEPANIVNNL